MATKKAARVGKMRGLLAPVMGDEPPLGLLAGRAFDAASDTASKAKSGPIAVNGGSRPIPEDQGLSARLDPIPAQAAPTRGLLGIKGAPTGGGLLGSAGRFADDFLFGGDYGRLRAERDTRDQGRAAADAHRAAYAEAMGPDGFNPTAYGAALARLGQAPDFPAIGALEGVTDSQDVRGARGRTEKRGLLAAVTAPYARTGQPIPEADIPALQDYLKQFGGGGLSLPTTASGVQSALAGGLGADGYGMGQRQWAQLDENARANLAGEKYRDSALDFQQRDAADRLKLSRDQFNADEAYRRDRAVSEDAYRAWQMKQPGSRSDIEGMVLKKAIESGVASLTPEEKAVYDRAVAVNQGGGYPFPMNPGGQGYGYGTAPLPGVAPQQLQPAPAQPRPQGQSGGGTAQNPARPQSDAEFQRLPVGAYFVDPDDGQTYRKGGQ